MMEDTCIYDPLIKCVHPCSACDYFVLDLTIGLETCMRPGPKDCPCINCKLNPFTRVVD